MIGELGALEVLELLPGLMRRGNLPERHIRRAQARRVVLSADRSCLFHGDGEILGPAPVEIEVLPGAIQVLAPGVVGDTGRNSGEVEWNCGWVKGGPCGLRVLPQEPSAALSLVNHNRATPPRVGCRGL